MSENGKQTAFELCRMLHTPLSRVVGITHFLSGAKLTPEEDYQLALLKAYAESAMATIEDGLDLAALESGECAFISIPFSLRTVLKSVNTQLAPLAHEQGFSVHWDIAPVADAVKGDPGRLRQILFNSAAYLLTQSKVSAISIQVTAQAEQADALNLQLQFKVQGEGAPRHEKRAPHFGLWVADALVTLMAGRLWIDPEATGVRDQAVSGIHIALSFPLQAEKRGVTHDSVDFSQLRALVLEEDAVDRARLLHMLTSWQVTVEAVAEAPAALAKVEEASEKGCPFDIVFFDRWVRGGDGFSFVEKLRAAGLAYSLIMVMLASQGKRGDAERCRETGVSVYFVKPVQPIELWNALRMVIGRLEEMPASEQALVTRYSVQEEDDRLQILLYEPNPDLTQLLGQVLEQQGHRVIPVETTHALQQRLAQPGADVIVLDAPVQGPHSRSELMTLIHYENRSHGNRIPMIILTDVGEQFVSEDCPQEVSCSLVKPFTVQSFLNTLDHLGFAQEKRDTL